MNNGSSPIKPVHNHTMQDMVKMRLAPPPSGGINPSYTPLDSHESHRNYSMAAHIRKTVGPYTIIKNRVVLPHDKDNSAQHRQLEWDKQRAMPWYSHFMHTPTDAQRLNNPAQIAAVRQRQLTIPNVYGQFYAFMKAMSAAFGTYRSGG